MTGIFSLGNTQTFRGESADGFAVELDTLFNDLDTAVRFLRTESIKPMSGIHHSALAFLERQTYVTHFPRFENSKGVDELTFRMEGVVDKIWEKIKEFFKWIYEKITGLFKTAEETPNVKPEEAKKVVEAVKQAVKAEESADGSGASKDKEEDQEFSDLTIKKVKAAIKKTRAVLRFSKNQDPVYDLELIKEAIENFKIISNNIIGLMNQDEISEDVVFNNTNSSKTQAEVAKNSKDISTDKGALFYVNFRRIQFLGISGNSVEKKNYSLESDREDYDLVEMAKALMEVGVNASMLSNEHKTVMGNVKSDIKALESKINEKKADPKLGEKARLVMSVYMTMYYTANDMIDTLNKCKSLVKETIY